MYINKNYINIYKNNKSTLANNGDVRQVASPGAAGNPMHFAAGSALTGQHDALNDTNLSLGLQNRTMVVE